MIDIYQLDLPDPSFELIQEANNIVIGTVLDRDGKIWLDQKNSTNNSAEHLFFVPEKIDQMVQAEFGYLFKHEIGGMMGIMKNTHSEYSNQPPHIDRGRCLAINYFLDLGGDEVRTSFYESTNSIDPNQSQNFTYDEVKKYRAGSVKFASNRWYAFEVNRCHSIENIIGTRYFLSIFFRKNPDQYTIKNLENDYPALIKNRVILDTNAKEVA